MDTSALRATLSLSLMAAFADGDKHEREREEIRRIAQGLGAEGAVHLPTLYQDVLLQRVTLADVAQGLPERGARQLAYEMAVCVCDADGALSPREQAFLAEARRVLALDGTAEAFESEARTLAEAPLAGPTALASAFGVSLPSIVPTGRRDVGDDRQARDGMLHNARDDRIRLPARLRLGTSLA